MIRSMLDNDQYKFTMQQAALKLGYANVPVEYKFKCRTPNINLSKAESHLNDALVGIYDLRMKSHDLDYLETMSYIKPEYLSFLKHFRFEPEYVSASFRCEDHVDHKVPEIRISGPYFYTTHFEVPLLAAIS